MRPEIESNKKTGGKGGKHDPDGSNRSDTTLSGPRWILAELDHEEEDFGEIGT